MDEFWAIVHTGYSRDEIFFWQRHARLVEDYLRQVCNKISSSLPYGPDEIFDPANCAPIIEAFGLASDVALDMLQIETTRCEVVYTNEPHRKRG